MASHSSLACLLVGQPTLQRRIKPGTFAALDQRIAAQPGPQGLFTTPDVLTDMLVWSRRPTRAAQRCMKAW